MICAMMNKCLILILLVLDAVLAQYPLCKDVVSTGQIVNMVVTNCSPDNPPCILRKGHDVGLSLTFIPASNSRSLSVKAYAVTFGVELPFVTLSREGCGPKYGVDCPLIKGNQYTYRNSFPVEKWYPSMRDFSTKWVLLDDAEDEIICVNVTASII